MENLIQQFEKNNGFLTAKDLHFQQVVTRYLHERNICIKLEKVRKF